MTSPQTFLTLLAVILAMALLSLAASEDDDLNLQELLAPHEISIRNARKYCGRNLSNALQALCGGIYNGPTKRVSNGRFFGIGRNSDSDFPVYSHEFGETVFTKRQLRGASDECCKKSCTINELTSYCGEEKR